MIQTDAASAKPNASPRQRVGERRRLRLQARLTWRDAGGALRVGPKSAGAQPGPACYGRGGRESTVTDANVVLGRIDPASFLGGEIRLDGDAARRAIHDGIAKPLGLTVEAAAEGIIRVINATMVRGMRAVSVEKGYDPREFALVAFGGGGPLHAADLARELGAQNVVIPIMPGVTSALGLLVADLRYDVSATVRRSLASPDLGALSTVYADLEAQALEQMARDGVDHGAVQLHRSADIRYARQSWELEITVPPGVLDPTAVALVGSEFHARHAQQYGYAMEGEELILVNAQVSAIAELPKPPLGLAGMASGGYRSGGPATQRRTWLGAAWVPAVVHQRGDLSPGATIEGPAIVEQLDTTTFLGRGDVARVDGFGNLIVTVAP